MTNIKATITKPLSKKMTPGEVLNSVAEGINAVDLEELNAAESELLKITQMLSSTQ